MEESNNLTKKEFWSENWKKMKLPVRYVHGDYSHQILTGLLDEYVAKKRGSFLEIGGCPGRWSDFFYNRFNMSCDSMDYDQNNVDITNENYRLLGIDGEAFLGDITDSNGVVRKKYDIVFSDGLVEHFKESGEVFKNHVRYLDSNGLLIIGVPNIKDSWLYDFFAKKDKVAYDGYRHIPAEELSKYAKENGLEVLFCGYIGVFNIGLVHSFALSFLITKGFVIIDLLSRMLLRMFGVKKETRLFSPYIYLIAKKDE